MFVLKIPNCIIIKLLRVLIEKSMVSRVIRQIKCYTYVNRKIANLQWYVSFSQRLIMSKRNNCSSVSSFQNSLHHKNEKNKISIEEHNFLLYLDQIPIKIITAWQQNKQIHIKKIFHKINERCIGDKKMFVKMTIEDDLMCFNNFCKKYCISVVKSIFINN